ncbi:MAG: hypothetical protein H7069_06415 [Phormidesmis sp. FL-bin-119]|nr:hypothetical protein [Pedobacter sp.]
MFEDYQASVVKHYQLKRTDGSLSLNVMKPKPSTIRKECLFVLATRANKGDLLTLRLFVGEKENEEEYGRAIRNIDVNIFKPLSNFLRGHTTNTEEKNIELLAWLIDYSPRPYRMTFTDSDVKPTLLETLPDADEKKELTENESNEINGGASDSKIPIAMPKNRAGFFVKQLDLHKIKIVVIVGVLITLVIGASLVKSRPNTFFLSFLKSDNQCMYWSGDRYVETTCDTKTPYGQIVALDNFKIANFKKIIRPDTLTENDINKVWYLKTNNELELYTSDGKHPQQPHRRLRPLSKYMFDKYVVGRKVRIN